VIRIASIRKVNCHVTTDGGITLEGTSSLNMSENKPKRIERPSIGSGPDDFVYCFRMNQTLENMTIERTYGKEET
jgi:hypothetical protein